MPDYLDAVMAMLGKDQNRHAEPSAWDRLHAELGVQLPSDYRVLVDAYAPIELNGHLSLFHPATERWNLGQWIRDTVRAWSEVSWDDLDADEDPRLLFGLKKLSFGVEDGEGDWSQHRMSFTEWLYRYLVGENMAGPHSSAFYPGPVQLRRLPMTAAERPEPWHGPDRGM
ncbi:SMI1/KNR4 family protein [Streptomyces sp. NPDC097704]|uniref:SMI1/KNR4 family protein n=1 Tax=Streptomyces sp. NPDC097704 TaxID=3157101 RepID=UPI00332564F5